MRSQSIAVGASALAATANAMLFEQVVQTVNGPVQGYQAFDSSPVNVTLSQWQNIGVWKGIPFGASTAYQNRFKPPQPVTPWTDVLEAKEFGDACISGRTTYATLSEDCLNLNVWSAANSTEDKLPVVMWSYPSGGANSDPRFDGGGMADKNVVFVNYNYRDGPTGYLVNQELNAERFAEVGVSSSGNYAQLDQYAALQWVRDNIAAFGGDPDHITVAGQSAGSAATYHILNCPLTQGQIVGAIIQSGIRDPYDPSAFALAEGYQTAADTEAYSTTFMESVNCTTIACLRELPASSLDVAGMPGTTSTTFKANLDYYAIPDTYLNTLTNGLTKDVPVMTGNTRDESGATYGLDISLESYLSTLNSTYDGDFPDLFFEAYPANDSASASAALNAQYTDRSKVGAQFWSDYLFTTNRTSPIFTYLWTHAPPGQTGGAAHMTEIQYTQNNLYNTYYPYSAENNDFAIAEIMNAYWVNFIKTGNPNGDGLVQWNEISTTTAVTQQLGDGWGPLAIASTEQIALFAEWFPTMTPI
ncbi:unnamed protein product [Discula destructiva]